MTVNMFNAHCFSHSSKSILDSIWKERSLNQNVLIFIAHGVFLQVYWLVFYATVVVQLLSHVRIFCDPMNCCPSGFSVHGISQAGILEWIVISSSRGFPWPRDRTHISGIGWQILYHWATRKALPCH